MTRAIVALVALLTALTLPAAAAASPPANQPRTDIIQLVSQSAAVDADGDFTLRLRVAGAPAGARVHAVVRNAVKTRSDFNAAAAGKVSRSGIGSAVDVPAVPDASGVVVVDIGTRDPQSQLPSDPQRVRIGEGVYPLTVDLLSSAGATLDSFVTFLIRLPTGRQFGPLGVAVVLPEAGRPSVRADGSTAVDATVAKTVLSHASVLQSHPDVPLTVTPSPETIDALAPTTVDELHKAMAGRQVPLTSYVPLHPDDWIAVGLDDELGRQFEHGRLTLGARVKAPDESAYVADNQLTAAAAKALGGRGVHSIVVPDNALAPLDERLFNRTLTQPFDLAGAAGVRAVAADTALSAHAGETGDPILDANHLLADLAVLYFDDPPDARGVVVAFGEEQHVDPLLLDALLNALGSPANRILQPMTLTTLFASVPAAGSRGETNGKGKPLERTLTPARGANLSAFASEVRSTEADVGSYRSMVTPDNPRADELDRRILVAGSDDLSDGERSDYLSHVRTSVQSEMAKVVPPPRQTINFTARDGVVSLTLRNTTGYPVKVVLRLLGEKLEFPGHEDGTFPITLTEETTRVSLNVRTRASGDSSLDISMDAPDGRLTLGRTRVTVRSTAFSGVGVILSVGSGLFLALWWLRHAVATRRERRRRLRHAAGRRPRDTPAAEAL